MRRNVSWQRKNLRKRPKARFQQVLHNDNIPIDGTIDGTRHFNGQAAHADVMAVAVSTSLNKQSAYSGSGTEISVCAPSNNFWPGDVSRTLPGRGIVTADNGRHGSGFDPTLYTERFGGTSSATPLAQRFRPRRPGHREAGSLGLAHRMNAHCEAQSLIHVNRFESAALLVYESTYTMTAKEKL